MKALATTAMLVALAGSAAAQMPFPFGSPPLTEPGKLEKCTKDYIASLNSQIAAMETLRTSGPQFVGTICSLIESGSAIIGGELSDETRHRLKGLLGVDIDLRFIRTQCRVSQGNLDREVMTHLGYLKGEAARCNDSI